MPRARRKAGGLAACSSSAKPKLRLVSILRSLQTEPYYFPSLARARWSKAWSSSLASGLVREKYARTNRPAKKKPMAPQTRPPSIG